ncbi:hypothetical protein BDHH15_07560 [Bradyrhizobium diazoefficiens]|uniref:Uncharacterized protein n=1 Tax=Bradyrhizobium diazoefficiens TaxID=1355477 RepID=A0A809Y9W1_9BRAD|nr:hypothetical protein H12S4_07610 [Bradyrhizobium diazoefficiens]BCA17541.1 hypothetical protein BDHH15_07560 [Bradyrhizobium diazoefficiens]BCE35725.1 hypothetical protein XF3B_07560 [Bradyrhizobium diazoefficiens]BCF49118.1 hypothetical protein XF17B_07560 [Bradyrhizobium diazoefficiens]
MDVGGEEVETGVGSVRAEIGAEMRVPFTVGNSVGNVVVTHPADLEHSPSAAESCVETAQPAVFLKEPLGDPGRAAELDEF